MKEMSGIGKKPTRKRIFEVDKSTLVSSSSTSLSSSSDETRGPLTSTIYKRARTSALNLSKDTQSIQKAKMFSGRPGQLVPRERASKNRRKPKRGKQDKAIQEIKKYKKSTKMFSGRPGQLVPRERASKNIRKPKRGKQDKAIQEIKQKSIDLLLRKAPFLRLVKETMSHVTSEHYLIELNALLALQEAAEAHIVQLFEDVLLCAIYVKGQLANRIHGRYESF